jgi:hypothetical protein
MAIRGGRADRRPPAARPHGAAPAALVERARAESEAPPPRAARAAPAQAEPPRAGLRVAVQVDQTRRAPAEDPAALRRAPAEDRAALRRVRAEDRAALRRVRAEDPVERRRVRAEDPAAARPAVAREAAAVTPADPVVQVLTPAPPTGAVAIYRAAETQTLASVACCSPPCSRWLVVGADHLPDSLRFKLVLAWVGRPPHA